MLDVVRRIIRPVVWQDCVQVGIHLLSNLEFQILLLAVAAVGSTCPIWLCSLVGITVRERGRFPRKTSLDKVFFCERLPIDQRQTLTKRPTLPTSSPITFFNPCHPLVIASLQFRSSAELSQLTKSGQPCGLSIVDHDQPSLLTIELQIIMDEHTESP